jgi:hypothetical protein
VFIYQTPESAYFLLESFEIKMKVYASERGNHNHYLATLKKNKMLQMLLNSFRQHYPKQGVASLFCARGESPISPTNPGTSRT